MFVRLLLLFLFIKLPCFTLIRNLSPINLCIRVSMQCYLICGFSLLFIKFDFSNTIIIDLCKWFRIWPKKNSSFFAVQTIKELSPFLPKLGNNQYRCVFHRDVTIFLELFMPKRYEKPLLGNSLIFRHNLNLIQCEYFSICCDFVHLIFNCHRLSTPGQLSHAYFHLLKKILYRNVSFIRFFCFFFAVSVVVFVHLQPKWAEKKIKSFRMVCVFSYFVRVLCCLVRFA